MIFIVYYISLLTKSQYKNTKVHKNASSGITLICEVRDGGFDTKNMDLCFLRMVLNPRIINADTGRIYGRNLIISIGKCFYGIIHIRHKRSDFNGVFIEDMYLC